ncbi:hypothetical protein RclHR1_19240003 [Rhizophagus clarus]|uniref:Crinkler effector protein N-terminal domain-containing protein n=1 Tax=Rhizophagus clarus TaxID=94130 RepID=A0A2Z6RHD8_9GLOM|nr:hypothetical protein RclHR1_19240003 [Rhizophagus clarus]
MIGCFILGSGTSFNFEIGEFEDFTKLSKALWEKNKDYFINTGVMNELNLKLWNVEIPTRNNKKYSELKKNPRVDIDVEQEFKGVEIDQTWLINSIFTASPLKEHIHIIVQPLPPATTGKRKHDDSDSDEESRTRKKDKRTSKTLASLLTSSILQPPVIKVPSHKIYNRDQALNSILKVARYNYEGRNTPDHKNHRFILIPGGIGIGKTRMGGNQSSASIRQELEL